MSALFDRYEYYLTHNGNTVQVYPDQEDTPIKIDREEGQLFFRMQIEDTMEFVGVAYDWLKAIEDGADRCLPITVTMKKKVPGSASVEEFVATTVLDNATFFPDFCRIELKVDSRDDAFLLTSIWEKTVNLLDGTVKTACYTNYNGLASGVLTSFEELVTEETITLTFGGANQFMNPDFPDDHDGWVMHKDTVAFIDNVISYNATRRVIWRREITNATFGAFDPAPAGGINPGGWAQVTISPGVYKWVHRIVSIPRSAEYSSTVHVLGSDPNYWFFTSYSQGYSWLPYDYNSIDNGLTTAVVFDKFLSGSGLTVASDFFQINPDATAPSNDVYGYLVHDNLLWFQRSDLLNIDAASNATLAEFTLKDFLEILSKKFNVWAVPDGITLRVEHLSYWEDNNGNDFSADPGSIGKGSYSYRRNNIPIGEDFMDETEAQSQYAFRRWSFSYDTSVSGDIPDNCAQAFKARIQNIAPLATDIQAMDAEPGNFSTDGLCCIACFIHSGQYIISGDSFYQNRTLNSLMMPRSEYLTDAHKWGRWLPYAIYQEPGSTTFWYFESWKKTKEQEEIEVSLDSFADIDPLQLQKSQLGWGEVESATFSPLNCTINLKLLHQ